MKLMLNATLLTTALIGSTVQAVEVPITCASETEYCRDEFVGMSAEKKSIEEAIAALPVHVRRNITFKRGNNMTKSVVGELGPHGHRVNATSKAATPDKPKAFAWDEKTGFTANWNSGDPNHMGHDRVDLYDFDFKKKTHRLEAWIPGRGMVDANFRDADGATCISCHGASQRPIFPMYPDWPQFYGEFNDEMTGYDARSLALRSDLKIMANQFQPMERQLYRDFLSNEARTNPRFTPLFQAKPAPIRPETRENPVYPYRPRTTTSPFSDVSRAFYNRPNLRLGVMYNRLTALQLFERIKASPIYRKYPEVVFYALMDCNWDAENTPKEGQEVRARVLGAVLEDARATSKLENFRGAKFPDGSYMSPDHTDPGYTQLPYENLLQLLDLKIEEVDIRFKANAGFKVRAGYGVFDPRAFYHTDSAMDIGYIKDTYAMNPICDNNGRACNFSYRGTFMQGMRYFNSYFDGSATTNELLAAQMLLHLTNTPGADDSDAIKSVRAALAPKVGNPSSYFETLQKKYARFTDRLNLDRPFFQKMDLIGPWIQLPFSPDMLNVQNREPFWSNGAAAVRAQHAQWLTLQDRTARRKNLNGGRNLCWNIYDVMKGRLGR